jgi:hypothetical protein
MCYIQRHFARKIISKILLSMFGKVFTQLPVCLTRDLSKKFELGKVYLKGKGKAVPLQA